MRVIGRVLRYIVNKIAFFGLFIVISVGIPLWAIVTQISDREGPKAWLEQADTYELAIDNSFKFIQEEAKQQTVGNALEDNPLIDIEALLGTVKSAITPLYLQQQVEAALGGAYDWLEGITQRPQFRFDLRDKKDQVAQNLRIELGTQLAALPACSPEQITPEFDLLEANCLPPGVDLESEIEKIVDSLAGEDGLLSEVSFDDQDMEIPQEVLVNVPNYYSLGLWLSFWLLPMLGSTFLLLAVMSAKSWPKGLRHAGWVFISASITTFFVALLLTQSKAIANSILARVTTSQEATEDATQAIINVFQPLLVTIISSVAKVTALIAGGFIGTGAVMMIVSWLIIRHQKKPAEEAQPPHHQPPQTVPEKSQPKPTPTEPAAEKLRPSEELLATKPKTAQPAIAKAQPDESAKTTPEDEMDVGPALRELTAEKSLPPDDARKIDSEEEVVSTDKNMSKTINIQEEPDDLEDAIDDDSGPRAEKEPDDSEPSDDKKPPEKPSGHKISIK